MIARAPRLRRGSAALLTTLVLLGACGGDDPELAETPDTTTTTEAPSTTTTVPEDPPALVAQAKSPDAIEVYDDADADTPSERFDGGQIRAADATSAPGIPIVFLVKTAGEDGDRHEVYLPVRPNGSTGWVDADDVDVTAVTHRIEVTIAEHRIRVFDGDELLVDEPIGVGTAETPSPGGIYYLKELLQPPNPNGPYGVYAYGLSGFSNELTSFAGGDGVIGIHGTNDPSTIGTDVSHGCIRLNNDVITRLVNDIGLPLGTPVEIIA